MGLPQRIFIISDLHLGVGNDLAIFKARAELAGFIDMVGAQDGAVELVILGDALDYLQLRPALEFTEATALRKTDDIIKYNEEVFAALRRFVTGGRTLVWFVGNHDLELMFPAVQRRIEAEIGGAPVWHLDDSARAYELKGGARIHLVHGNDADVFNAVDYANVAAVVAGGGDAGKVYPIGSRLVAEVLNALKEDQYTYIDLLKPEEEVAVPLTLALWPDDILGLLKLAAPILAKGKVREKLERLQARVLGRRRVFRGEKRQDAPEGGAPDEGELLPLGLLRALAEGEGAGDNLQPEALAEWLEDPEPPALLTGKRVMRSGGGGVPMALLRGAIFANTRRDPFAVRGPDLNAAAAAALADEKVILVVIGHTHLARALDGESGYYINTGTWAELMRVPPELAKTEFLRVAKDMREHLRDPSKGPEWLRPFVYATYAEITLPDGTGGSEWHARLCQWKDGATKPLVSFPDGPGSDQTDAA